MRPPSLRRRLEAAWYGPAPVLPFVPLALAYGAVLRLRRGAHAVGLGRAVRLPVPVVVVGNIAVGGTGKTPVVGWLAGLARQRGFQPGIVARGYGGRVGAGPHRVGPGDAAALVGDEAVLHHRSGFPVVLGSDRTRAAARLVEAGCDLVIADDGLQHLALARDREVIVIDGDRRAGNGWLLPAGPLREPWSALGRADLILVNGADDSATDWPAAIPRGSFRLAADELLAFGGDAPMPLAELRGRRVYALAGIGNPGRFYRMLAAAGIDVVPVPADDHGRASAAALAAATDAPLLMTAKDAVKYAAADQPAGANWWVVPVRLEPSAIAAEAATALLDGLRPAPRTSLTGMPREA